VDLDPINRATFRQNVQELAPVGIIRKDVPAFVAPASDVVPGAGVLNPQGAGHRILSRDIKFDNVGKTDQYLFIASTACQSIVKV
jgi:hypothetical protein